MTTGDSNDSETADDEETVVVNVSDSGTGKEAASLTATVHSADSGDGVDKSNFSRILQIVQATTATADALLDTRDPPGRIQKLSAAERIEEARANQADQANRLRTGYGVTLLLLILLQIALADAIFVAYAAWGAKWNIPATIMNVWLSATVVEMIGIVAIVVHYLFPSAENKT